MKKVCSGGQFKETVFENKAWSPIPEPFGLNKLTSFIKEGHLPAK